MSYDICLKDPVTKKTIEVEHRHFMTGGTLALGGTRELWLNITYNYSYYYYDATDGDERFAHDEVSCYYADGTTGETLTYYGIRGIYGKTGEESIQMLEDMIRRIEEKYKKDGEWISTKRKRRVCVNEYGREIDEYKAIVNGIPHRYEEHEIEVNEGESEDYWEATAVNAIKPLHQLIAMARMRPDGIWDGD